MVWIRRILGHLLENNKNRKSADFTVGAAEELIIPIPPPVIAPVEAVVISVEPLMDDIPLNLDIDTLKKAWSGIIIRIADLDRDIQNALKERIYALGIVDNTTVELFVNDGELFTTLQNTPAALHAIADALTETFHTTLSFTVTDELIIPPPDIDTSPVELEANIVDFIVRRFIQESEQYSVFKPRENVYSLLVDENELELHWFQICREDEQDKTMPEFLDVFCISTLNRIPIKERRGLKVRFISGGITWQTIESRYADTLGLEIDSCEPIADKIFSQIAKEHFPVSSNTFFLVLPEFPGTGIHSLTKLFDFAPEKLTSLNSLPKRITPIPFNISTLEQGRADQADNKKILNENIHNWLKRKNRYLRKDPVTGSDYYRTDAIESSILKHIENGNTFGLFGLRRMGKTSILYEMRRKRSFDHLAYVSLLDVQSFAGRPLWGVFVTAMRDWLQQLGTTVSTEQHESFCLINIPPGGSIHHDQIHTDIERLISLLPHDKKLVLILDEIGHLLPVSPERILFQEWWEFLACLRHIRNETGLRFVLGMAAYETDIVYNDLGGNRNPWYLQIEHISIQPLSRFDCDRMVQDIGAIAGIYYTPEALQLLYESTSGHPQITRELCSSFAELPRDQRPHMVELVEMDNAINHFVDKNQTIRAMYRALQELEQRIVEYLANARFVKKDDLYHAFKQDFKDDPEFDTTIRRMSEYGLIEKEDQEKTLSLRFGLFKKYLVGRNQAGGSK